MTIHGRGAVGVFVKDTDTEDTQVDAGELAVESWILGGGLRFGSCSRSG
jgi:hypothetical protein